MALRISIYLRRTLTIHVHTRPFLCRRIVQMSSPHLADGKWCDNRVSVSRGGCFIRDVCWEAGRVCRIMSLLESGRTPSHVESFVRELTFVSGSEKPAEVEGQPRLYSMAYCPFAHRIRLVLSQKQIPHDIVNINLQSKPQWFLQVRSSHFQGDDSICSESKEFLTLFKRRSCY